MSQENQNTSDKTSDKVKDYSKYFDFSDAKLVSKDEGKTTYPLKDEIFKLIQPYL